MRKAFRKDFKKRPLQKLQSDIERQRRKEFAEARWRAAELHANYAKEKGYHKKIARELIRLFQITSVGLGERPLFDEKTMRDLFWKNPTEVAKNIIVVPKDSPYYGKVFEIGTKRELFLLKHGKYVFLREELMEMPEGEFREKLRHELSHAIFGPSEIIPQLFSQREFLERMPRGARKWYSKFLAKSYMKMSRKAETEGDKRYHAETSFGVRASRMMVEINKKYGGEAARRFLVDLIIAQPKTLQEIERIRNDVVKIAKAKRRGK